MTHEDKKVIEGLSRRLQHAKTQSQSASTASEGTYGFYGLGRNSPVSQTGHAKGNSVGCGQTIFSTASANLQRSPYAASPRY